MAERCEVRTLLSTFVVANLNDSGPGSLRQALLDLDGSTGTGPNVVDFQVTGTIRLTSGALPEIARPVTVDGTSAPGFSAGSRPLVAVDNGGFAGLVFGPGSDGSSLRSLAIGGSGSDGLTLEAPAIQVIGNTIGLGLDGLTLDANAGNGIVIEPESLADTIGALSTFAPGTVISAASNVISGNGLNGILVIGSLGNVIAANEIGTDATGRIARGNGGCGILLRNGASGNTIGGTIPFVNSPNGMAPPDAGLQVPDTNVISANHLDGILIENTSLSNQVSGNLIGTDATGLAPLGNLGDGVAILTGSNDNIISGTTATQNPFIYANIISANRGNGLRISDSNGNQVLANFLGLGVDNATPLGNGEDGALIEGTSTGTSFGGLIPLGNVTASNGGNGLEIRDFASNTLVSNTFCGVAAFSDQANLGNGLDGMLITTPSGGITIHTGNIIARNGGNGIEIGGDASGVQIYADFIGTNTTGTVALPNGVDGVRIDGTAHGNSVGSRATETNAGPSLPALMNATRTIIAANQGNGVSILGSAHDNQIINDYLGAKPKGAVALGNGGSGIYLGESSVRTTVGGPVNGLGNLISGNFGGGITINGSGSNVIQGNAIGTDATGTAPLANGENGILVNNSSGNLVGGTTSGASNTIAFNESSGVTVRSGQGNAIRRNAIFNNQAAGIALQSGANGNQPPPRLTHTKKEGKLLGIGGNIQAAPRTTYQVELFSSPAGQTTPSSGQTYLATDRVVTNRQGFARFRFFVKPPTATSPVFFTATASNAANGTSMFSNPLRPGTVE